MTAPEVLRHLRSSDVNSPSVLESLITLDSRPLSIYAKFPSHPNTSRAQLLSMCHTQRVVPAAAADKYIIIFRGFGSGPLRPF